jgi:uncharacterized protein YdeI (YjbR/CyaY-like superfamily)
MAEKITTIDDYIKASASFAQPILEHIRALVHEVCPDVEEKIKWNFPHFDYLGEMMCSMAAFKQHCAMGFWKAALMQDPVLTARAATEEAMGHLGRITSVKDLPSNRKLKAYIKEAMQLNAEGRKLAPRPKQVLQETELPADFALVLKKNPTAWKVFQAFAPSHRKEYIRWITEAKTVATRNKRMATAVEWIAEKKGKNWPYEKKKA